MRKIELEKKEITMLISCLNDRKHVYDNGNFKEIRQYTHADWAEKVKDTHTIEVVRHYDTISKLLVTLGYKDKGDLFLYEEYFNSIKKLKSCKQMFLYGKKDFYKIRFWAETNETFPIQLKDIGFKLQDNWEKQNLAWFEKEKVDESTRLVTRKEALKMVKSNAVYSVLNSDMKRFLDVVLI